MTIVKLFKTEDGSVTLFNEKLKEVYHSIHGAITESRHVFIHAGLEHLLQSVKNVSLLEVGMGTGLNVLLSAIAAEARQIHIRYEGIEPFPPDQKLIDQLNYPSMLPPGSEDIWNNIHSAKWEEWVRIHSNTELLKRNLKIEEVHYPKEHFHLVYFDAFAPEVQSELWELEIFEKIYTWMCPGGVLVTYSAKGDVRRKLKTTGFKTERIPGPPGKREMLRAIKPTTG